MFRAPTWEDLVNDLEKVRQRSERLDAQWHAYVGTEKYGNWLLIPDGPATLEARATLGFVAARAIEKLDIPPIPTPLPSQYLPYWSAYCAAQEKSGKRSGQPVESSGQVPYGFGTVDADAVDPCTRAWLELLRRESGVFQTYSSSLTFGGSTYATVHARITDVCAVSAAFCTFRARDEIAARLTYRWAVPDSSGGSLAGQPPAPNLSGEVEPLEPEDVSQRKVEPVSPKRRGRPIQISAERKEKALAVQGGRTRAQILYNTPYPTPQQVKNVHSILRNYRKHRVPDQNSCADDSIPKPQGG